jgi:hypothetical protein
MGAAAGNKVLNRIAGEAYCRPRTLVFSSMCPTLAGRAGIVCDDFGLGGLLLPSFP